MSNDSQELLEFLYRSPIALIRANLDGAIQMITPMACQWLMPLSKDGNLENLFVLLADVAPTLKKQVGTLAPTGICEPMVLRINAPESPTRYLALSLERFSDDSIAAVFSDVSDERRQISESHKRLRDIVDRLPSMVGYWDAQLNNRFANKAYSSYFKCDPDQLLGRNIKELLGESIYQANLPFIKRALAGEDVTFERSIPKVDGNGFRHTLAHYLPDIQEGEVKGFHVLVNDITAQVVQKERLDDLYNNAPSGYHSVDMNGVVQLMNDTELTWLGRTRDEVVGKHRITDFMTPNSIEIFKSNFPRFMAKGIVQDLEFEFVRKDGSTFPALLSAIAEYDDQGRFKGSRSTILDYSKVKSHQDALRRVLAASPMAVRIARLSDHQVVFMNEAFCDLVHRSAEEATGMDISQNYRDRSVFESIKQRLGNGETVLNELIELCLPDRPGVPNVWVMASYMAINYEGQDSVLAWLYDVTALQNAKQESEAAYKSKGQFLATMSHEIRTPMNAILGMLKLLEGTELTTRQRDYASKANGAAQSLLGLLDDILDLSKVDAGKMQLESRPFRLDSMLRNLSVVLSSNIKKDIEVIFDVDPQLPEVIEGDVFRLQQILINLGGNAVKFTEKGQVVVSLELKFATDKNVTISFAIKDSGIGIAPENQQKIFAGFSQAEASTTRRFGGTGLGLAISKNLTQLMGGTLNLASAEGEGSTFSFELEFPKVDTIPDSLQIPSRQRPVAQRVLLIDDNTISNRVMFKMLRAMDWSVDEAVSGMQALEILHTELGKNAGVFPYSLVIVNWQMPQLDGWQISKQIQEVAQQCKGASPTVIMVSDNGRQDLSQRSAEEQSIIHGFLVKPFTAAMLLDTVMDAKVETTGLRRRSVERANKRQLQGMRILVVEDNLINQQVADELLTNEGAIVSMAANGLLGVDAVRHAAPQYDVVLMDIQMPVMDGYSATSAIRNELGLIQLPIIAMTANAMASDRDACIASGMNEHIGKPFDMGKLVSLLIRTTGLNVDSKPEDQQAKTQTSDALPLPSIDGIDVSGALKRMSGSRSLYVRTAKDFLRVLSTVHTDLRQQLEIDNRPQIAMTLHTLKGNAGTLGLTELAIESRRLEHLCKSDVGVQQCAEEMESLKNHLKKAGALLEQAITGIEVNQPKTDSLGANVGSSSEMMEALDVLMPLLEQSDMEALQKFAESRELLKLLPDGTYDSLEAALQDLDFQVAYQKCLTAKAALNR